jgi:hypothetical protein
LKADQAAKAEEISIKDLCKEEGVTLEGTTIKEEEEEIFSHIMMTQINIVHTISHSKLKTINPKSQ